MCVVSHSAYFNLSQQKMKNRETNKQGKKTAPGRRHQISKVLCVCVLAFGRTSNNNKNDNIKKIPECCDYGENEISGENGIVNVFSSVFLYDCFTTLALNSSGNQRLLPFACFDCTIPW